MTNNKYSTERWKRIEFEGIHPDEKVFISDFGRIRSFKTSREGGKIIGGSWLSNYNIIVLRTKDDGRKTIFIHKMVAEYFLPEPSDDKKIVIHLDYNRKNNHYTNLRWVSQKEATEHRRNDKDYDTKKVRNAKLTAEKVIEIKKLLKEGKMRPFRIAQLYRITHTQLNRIKSGENWSHIKID